MIDKDQLQNEPTKYLFIVAAKNELGGLPVFRVVKNIQKVNRSGPLAVSYTHLAKSGGDPRLPLCAACYTDPGVPQDTRKDEQR